MHGGRGTGEEICTRKRLSRDTVCSITRQDKNEDEESNVIGSSIEVTKANQKVTPFSK